MDRTAIIICSYNMPEYTDNLVEHIQETVKLPYDLIVFDNGSDLVPPSQHTTHSIDKNIQMVPGFMYALRQATGTYDAYWLLTTSCRFDYNDKRDPLRILLQVFDVDPLAYAVQPSLNIDFGAWKVLLAPRTPPVPRRVWGLELVCPVYRAKYFDELGRWNEKLIRGWGISAESCYFARRAGYHIYTHDGYVMNKDTWVGYKMDRMNETAKDRCRLAAEEYDREFLPKYGPNYLDFLNYSHRETNRGDY